MTESSDDAENEIRRRAYMIWLDEGRPDGRAEDHWHQAVAEIREEAKRADRLGSSTDSTTNKPQRSRK